MSKLSFPEASYKEKFLIMLKFMNTVQLNSHYIKQRLVFWEILSSFLLKLRFFNRSVWKSVNFDEKEYDENIADSSFN